MNNYIAVVFADMTRAYEGLHALWDLDGEGEITVHGTTVVHRDALGQFRIDTKETHPALATAIGVGVGALLGLLAGPAGLAMGAAGGAVIGATAGGLAGIVADLDRSDTRNEADDEASFVLHTGQSAVIADVSEDQLASIDITMKSLGGRVYRRSKSAIRNQAWFDNNYLYPYEYVPSRHFSDW
jgi:uncharacterized membrane protein